MCDCPAWSGCPNCSPEDHFSYCIERYDELGFCICERHRCLMCGEPIFNEDNNYCDTC